MCKICEIMEDKKTLVYEDEMVAVALEPEPVANCQLVVFPKKHVQESAEIKPDELTHIYAIATIAATTIFEAAGAAGTNIIAHEQTQTDKDHFHIAIIPRAEEDGINIKWEPQKLSPEDMDEMMSKIKSEGILIGKKEEFEEMLEQNQETGTDKTSNQKNEKNANDTEKEKIQEKTNQEDADKSSSKSEEKKKKKSENYLIKQVKRIP